MEMILLDMSMRGLEGGATKSVQSGCSNSHREVI